MRTEAVSPGSYPVCVSFAVRHIYGFVIVTAAVNPRLSSVKNPRLYSAKISVPPEKFINLMGSAISPK